MASTSMYLSHELVNLKVQNYQIELSFKVILSSLQVQHIF